MGFKDCHGTKGPEKPDPMVAGLEISTPEERMASHLLAWRRLCASPCSEQSHNLQGTQAALLLQSGQAAWLGIADCIGRRRGSLTECQAPSPVARALRPRTDHFTV